MNKHDSLIIFDWDDTLFPTSWTVKNGVDLTQTYKISNYISHFANLDNLISSILTKSSKYGKTIIITNAVVKWVHTTLVVLPKTKKIIDDKIIIISARELNQNTYPNEIDKWKSTTFKHINKGHNFKNIMSIGDAEYEFNALVDLYDINAYLKNKLLKTVRLVRDPSFTILVDQLGVLDKSIVKIIVACKHMDLKFT